MHQYVAPTSYVRDQLIAGDFPESRISVKSNFIKDPQLIPKHPKGGDYFIYVARLTREKGLEVLFNAWDKRKQHATLRLVGGGAVPDGLAVPEGVTILGEKPLSETYALIAGARALILPAQWAEPFGRVVIEAFALGTPVISSSAGGLTELVKHNFTGLLVEPGDKDALAKAIDRLSGDEDLCARLSQNARESYLASFTDKVNYDALMAIYKRAIETSSRASS